MTTVVNIQGQIVPPAEAAVSVFDRGFLYGDSVYEVVRTYRQEPFELERHLARLDRSAARLGLGLPWDGRRTREEILRTLAASQGEDPPEEGTAPWNAGQRSLRVIMTRGCGELELDPASARDPLAIVMASPLRAPKQVSYREGVACRIVGVRHGAKGDADTTAKTGAHLSNVLATREARLLGAHEAFLLDREGLVTEGASSNVFLVRGGRILTPPLAVGILEGVTRGIVIELAREAGIEVGEGSLRVEDLTAADEIFITSTAREVLPVTTLDGRVVRSGQVGEVTTRLHALFRARADGASRAR
ncbi:MAG TPA: aminotransferase class IV [Anaeromyxobacteraceae bacterium]|nr:aminotransferase class IV [Anaeromyxobacteraceae bacterium]